MQAPKVTLSSWLQRPERKTRPKLVFDECTSSDYPVRTAVNVKTTDGTLLIAYDLETPGEKLTRKLCGEHKKPLLQVEVGLQLRVNKTSAEVAHWIEKEGIRDLNIAGNCMERFPDSTTIQDLTDTVVALLKDSASTLTRIQSGGQGGIDEAGIKAGLQLDIPTKIVAPAGWKFRVRGKDIACESSFKDRFPVPDK